MSSVVRGCRAYVLFTEHLEPTPPPSEATLQIHLSPALRSRFERAWSLVPDYLRSYLSVFLRSARSVAPGRSVRLRLSDGTTESIDLREGPAVFLLDQSASPYRGWLLLREDLADRPEPLLVLMILHELAHAVRAVEDPLRAVEVPAHRAEVAAWLQAGAWAVHSPSGDDAEEMAVTAISRAREELVDWPTLSSPG